RPKPPVFKTGALPIMLTLLQRLDEALIVLAYACSCPAEGRVLRSEEWKSSVDFCYTLPR
ncbi:MAG TPA: hypothetical protein PLZ53_07675, partial [Candidatus Hydrogenedentes bacterium]|nr:hypothetical protein [Candidatus Hydrogenedentota bacterium]